MLIDSFVHLDFMIKEDKGYVGNILHNDANNILKTTFNWLVKTFSERVYTLLLFLEGFEAVYIYIHR